METNPPLPRLVWSGDFDAAPALPAWLWHGYLAPGAVTLLTSQWKSGKTTLVALLLARRKSGGLLAGRAVTAGATAVVSEEGVGIWSQRCRKLDFGPGVALFCRPFRARPTLEQWQTLLDDLAGLRAQRGVDLVVIDPLAAFLPSEENLAASLLEGLLPLQQLTGLGMGVLLLHHPRKGEWRPGHMARGSGALGGYVDVLVEMDWITRGDLADRRRRLQAFSRHDETPRQLVIELNADGTDYLVHEVVEASEFTRHWDRLRLVLEDAAAKLTRREVLAQWPEDLGRPSEVSVWRWLETAVAAGLVCREGTGGRTSPFRYWLPDREAPGQLDPLRPPELPDRQVLEEAKPPRTERLKRRAGGRGKQAE
jgi:hypothetical protein